MYEEELKYMEKLLLKTNLTISHIKLKPNANPEELTNLYKKQEIQESIIQCLKRSTENEQ